MRLGWLIGGAVITMLSIPSYYYSPGYLSQAAHSFVNSMTNDNPGNSMSMLHQMGYPHLSVIITAVQYLLIGTAWTGIGLVAYGLVAKKKSKPMVVKMVAEEQPATRDADHADSPMMTKTPHTSGGEESVAQGVVNDVLTKLETQLKEIKNGYEVHKQSMEEERRNLEQRERERMAKIIATGEVLIKEIPPERFEERVKHYVELKNEETGLPIDLSLLADKFERMRKMLDSRGKSDLTPSEFDSFRRFLD